MFHLLYLVFFTSLAFSFRAVSSITIGIMIVMGLVLNPQTRKGLFHDKKRNLLLAACTLFLLLQFSGLFYTDHPKETWSGIRIKTGIVLVPLAVMLSLPGIVSKKKLLLHFCLILCAASLYCLFSSFQLFRHSGNPSVFFYHDLVKPIRQHAVYFSLLVFIGLLFLLESLRTKDLPANKPLVIALLIYLSGLLILLSSRLVIGFYLAFLAYYTIKHLKATHSNRAAAMALSLVVIVGIIIVFTIKNPVRERFADILRGDIALVTQDQFNPGVYFNGLQFRLLQWRFVTEILNENNAWWLGISPGGAQPALNDKYISKNMYIGDPARNDHGYLTYNTHNQLLEAILQNGIVGLILVLVIFYSLFRIVKVKKQSIASFTLFLFLAWLFMESVFETQYGIVIFFFPLFLSYDKSGWAAS